MLSVSNLDILHNEFVKPSIDKLTICGKSNLDILNDDIELLVATHGKNFYLYKEQISDRFAHYKRLINISYKHKYENGSYEVFTLCLKIGFIGTSNGATYLEQRKFQLEYNPNKFVIPQWFHNYLYNREYYIEEIKNIDLAFDFVGFSKNRFKYVLNSGNTTVASIGTLMNKTDYLGFSDKSRNRIKVYDKKKERSEYVELSDEVTRVEITLEYKHSSKQGFFNSSDMFSLEHACDCLSQIVISSDDMSDAFVFALSCLSSDELDKALSLMSQNTRKKYKRLLKEQGGYSLYCHSIDLAFFIAESIERILDVFSIRYTTSYMFG